MVLMQQMMKNIQTIQDALQSNNRPDRGRDCGRDEGRYNQNGGGRERGRNAPGRHRNCGQYYYTHGNYAHTSVACEMSGTDHNVNTTFANMMGGSTSGCYYM